MTEGIIGKTIEQYEKIQLSEKYGKYMYTLNKNLVYWKEDKKNYWDTGSECSKNLCF